MELMKEWFDDLQNKPKTIWKKTITVKGICGMHTGPSIRYASLMLEFSPSNQFTIESNLSDEVIKLIYEQNWYKSITFGILDVLCTVPLNPIRDIKITIKDIQYNEIESTPIAFRLAARDATRKALNEHFPINI